jgi:murein DD-endopeptidase MepM/ murein hydrolase activator NlpD
MPNFINPAFGIITDLYGYRKNPILKVKEYHSGIDIAMEVGTSLVAVYDGVIIDIGESASYGKYIKYLTKSGHVIKYAHLYATIANVYDEVLQNEIIAISGNTGLSTGPHLHYTIKYNDKTIDPINFVTLPYTETVKNMKLERLANSAI